MARTRFDAKVSNYTRSEILGRIRELLPKCGIPDTNSFLDVLLYVVDLPPFPRAYEAVWCDSLGQVQRAWIDERLLTKSPSTLDGETRGVGLYAPRVSITAEEMLAEWAYGAAILHLENRARSTPQLEGRVSATELYLTWVSGKHALRTFIPDRDVPQYHVLTGAYGEIPDRGVINFHLAHDLSWDAALAMVRGLFYGGQKINIPVQDPEGHTLYMCDETRTWAMIRPASGSGSRVVPFQLLNLDSEVNTSTLALWAMTPDSYTLYKNKSANTK